MKQWITAALFLAATQASAVVNAPVNIVYPIQGQTYFNYVTSSFSVTCRGYHEVKWGFDGTTPIGSTFFVDQVTVQFSYKLSSGNHTLTVDSNCGSEKANFNVQ